MNGDRSGVWLDTNEARVDRRGEPAVNCYDRAFLCPILSDKGPHRISFWALIEPWAFSPANPAISTTQRSKITHASLSLIPSLSRWQSSLVHVLVNRAKPTSSLRHSS